MGHALALGSLPRFVLAANLNKILDALIESSQVSQLTAKWAESRRDSLKALMLMSVTLTDDIGKGLILLFWSFLMF